MRYHHSGKFAPALGYCKSMWPPKQFGPAKLSCGSLKAHAYVDEVESIKSYFSCACQIMASETFQLVPVDVPRCVNIRLLAILYRYNLQLADCLSLLRQTFACQQKWIEWCGPAVAPASIWFAALDITIYYHLHIRHLRSDRTSPMMQRIIISVCLHYLNTTIISLSA